MNDSIWIPLTKGQRTQVSASDADLAHMKWYAHCCLDGGYYARRSDWVEGRMTRTFLHRVILGRELGRELLRGEITDHINGDRLDNRRDNLRLATTSENTQNRRSHRGSSSRYLGVSWEAQKGMWRAQIRVDGFRHHLGLFHDEEEAAHAYDNAAREHYGEFARPNFPPLGGTS